MRTLVRLVAFVGLTSCAHSAPEPRYIAPEPRPVPNATRLRQLIQELPRLEGAFTEPDRVYALIADQRSIAEIASADTAAIPLLVECLRDERPARVQFLGKPVTAGMVCAYTLVGTRYVQHRLQYSCFPQEWHGVVTPTLDVARLRAAWQDWQSWLADHPLDGRTVTEMPPVRCSWQTVYPCTCPP